ncbi:MAG TPA: AI-2E family transporter [Spongiibacteraceae bacterium]|nr:AI-2E family transporter [Spongiibacteraceae bacterium]
MQNKLAQGSFLLSLIIVTLLFGWILQPFSGAILWAAVTAVLFYPLQRRWAPRFGERKNLLAFTVLSLSTIIVILPLLALVVTLAQEGANLYQKVQSGEIDLSNYLDLGSRLPASLQSIVDRFGIDLKGPRQMVKEASVQATHYFANQALSFGQNTAQFFVAFALMLYLTFFFLRDGAVLVRLLVRALPLGDAREILLLHKISEVVSATVRGNFVVALVQGTLGGLIFWILDIEAALLWGVTMVFASLIPSVGAALIWGPVAIYFLLTGAFWPGVILIGFGAGVIGLVDNLLRPILVGRSTRMPDYLVLVSTLGGISIFGLNGFVLGPLIAVLFISFWGLFIREFNPA